jgi:diacylglycerol kinase (ATP)
MRVLLIHNPKAGDDDHEGEHLVELASGAGHHVTYVRSKDHWKSGLEDAPELVVVAGGDGTVAEVARATAGREIPLTILPAGTANNIAGALGLAGVEPEALIAGWTRGTLRPFDLGIAAGPWGRTTFLESVGVGALAELMAEIDEGDSGYVNELEAREQRLEAAIEVLQRIVGGSAGVRCKLEIDGRHVSGEYLLVEVLNFGAAGPNLRLAPGADGGDGRLDVVLVGTGDRGKLTQHLLTSDAEPRPSGLWQAYQGRRIGLRCDGSLLHIDDELRRSNGERMEVVVEVEPAGLRVLVPGR